MISPQLNAPTNFGTQIPPTMFNIKSNSSLKIFLAIIALASYLFLTLCYVATNNVIIEYVFMSLSLGLTLCIVVCYFKDM